jgi:hypothetical protein
MLSHGCKSEKRSCPTYRDRLDLGRRNQLLGTISHILTNADTICNLEQNNLSMLTGSGCKVEN